MQESTNPFTSKPIESKIIKAKQGIWRTYDATDGLPGGVECLLQDRQGYLWLGTSVESAAVGTGIGTGLCRYDGKEFITYTTDDGLAHNRIISIYEDRTGKLWLGTPKGVSCYDGQRFTSYTTVNGLVDNYICEICEDHQGRLWFATREGGITCYDGYRFTTYTTENGLPHIGVSAICKDHRGYLWLGTRGIDSIAISYFDGQNVVICYTTTDGLLGDFIYTIREDHHGRLWFGTDNGVLMFNGRGFTNYNAENGLVNNHINTIYEDHHGILWFGYEWAGGGVSCLINPEQSQGDELCFVTYTTKDGLLSNEVYDIIQDSERHMWFAHIRSGLTCFDSETVQQLTEVPVSNVLIQDTKRRLWFGSSNELNCIHFDPLPSNQTGELEKIHDLNPSLCNGDRLEYHKDKAWAELPERQKHQTFSAIIHALLEDSNGGFWIGTQGDGIYYYKSSDDVWESAGKHFTMEDGLSNNVVLSLLETRNGVIWAGTWADAWIFGNHACLCRFDGKEFETIPTPHPVISRLFEDSRGRVWIGGWAGGGLSYFDGDNFMNYTMADGLLNDYIVSITEDNAGNLWIGTLQGLCCFNGDSFIKYGEEQGLSLLRHQWSVKDVTGHLWFGTLMGGLYRTDGKHFQQLTMFDCLPNNCITGLVPQPDGSMIIGTYHGIVHYQSIATSSPRIEIREVSADQIYQNPIELVLTTTSANLLTITYHGLSLATHRMRYSYILEGYDKEWHETWERQVLYENLPIGEYTFKVIAINRDLVASEAPAEMKLKIVQDPRDIKVNELESSLIIKSQQLAFLQRKAEREYQFENIIGKSEAIEWVKNMMITAIESGLNVLITGETGTGKEQIAMGIHYNSPRKDKPWITYNCGTAQKEFIKSDLFGHRKGSFTGAIENKIGLFETAQSGTVLLDEIGDMPSDAQTHLLDVLEKHKVQRLGEYILRDVDVRVISMTNRDLSNEMKEGRFREDLYFRLNRFHIYIPPLRDRRDDIPLLAEHFYHKACHEQNKELDGFATGVIDMLVSYQWPGNVRELENEINRACALAQAGSAIQSYHFTPNITHGESLAQEILSKRMDYNESLKQFRRRLIEKTLQECDGNRTKAAKMRGIDRTNLVHLIKSLGIK